MVDEIPRSKRVGLANRRDLFALTTMRRENAQWLISTHNGHITVIHKIETPLVLQSIPLWWLAYFEANDLNLG